MSEDRALTPLERWRLVLGEAAGDTIGDGSELASAYDAALGFLYDREAEGDGRGIRTGDRRGSLDASRLTVPEWLDQIHALFPKETIERLEQDAVERYGIDEIVTDPEVLKRVEPNEALLRAVLRTKHLMNEELLALARQLVRRVVEQLLALLRREVKSAFSGALDRRRRSNLRVAKNFDLAGTLRANLKHWDAERARVVIERPLFHSRTRQHAEKWQVILLVDQSGSMLDSTIHAAVTASCFFGVPGLKTHLVAFDTEVVDLTSDVTDPVEVLMRVQLGGGTDIARAVGYAAALVENPRRTIVVLITDFFEGGDPYSLVRRVQALCEQGATVLGLAALDRDATPQYDRELAARCAAAGAHVGAMTPGELAAFVAEKLGR